MLYEQKTYRSYLKGVLAERAAKNPAYSLRAMARQLGLQPSHLSAILNGTKSLSASRAMILAEKLGLLGVDAEYFCLLVELDQAKTPDLKETYLKRLRSLNQRYEIKDLSLDTFRMICDWYHLPVLEMTELEGFDFSPESIAKRLGILKVEAELAVERLERLELIERDPATHRYQKVQSNIVFKSEVPNTALRSFHKQMLSKAAHSLETQSPQERYVGSQTFSIDPSQLDEARKLIEEFRKAMVQLFDQGKKKTQTYHLGVQLFNLTPTPKEEEKSK